MILIHFLTGRAAAGRASITCERTPILLRVTCKGVGQFDVLDQLDDEARDEESIEVYILDAPPRAAFIDGRDKKGRRWSAQGIASYRALEHQPGDEHTRNNASWVLWCGANGDRLNPEWNKQGAQQCKSNTDPSNAGR